MKRTLSEMLDVSLGGITTLRTELLFSASKNTGACIPDDWSSIALYAQLEKDGLTVETLDAPKGSRRWLITDAGSALLKEHDVMA